MIRIRGFASRPFERFALVKGARLTGATLPERRGQGTGSGPNADPLTSKANV